MSRIHYYAALTAQAIHFEGLRAVNFEAFTISVYDELPVVGFSYKHFRAAVADAVRIGPEQGWS